MVIVYNFDALYKLFLKEKHKGDEFSVIFVKRA